MLQEGMADSILLLRVPHRVLVEFWVRCGEQLVTRKDGVGTGHEHQRLLALAETQTAWECRGSPLADSDRITRETWLQEVRGAGPLSLGYQPRIEVPVL